MSVVEKVYGKLSADQLREFVAFLPGLLAMVDRYTKYPTEHPAVAATQIERVRAENVGNIVTSAKERRT